VFFAWGEIYSRFPLYGNRYLRRYLRDHQTPGLMYTAKGTAALLVPFTSVMAAKGTGTPVFMAAAVLQHRAALMAILILKPPARHVTNRSANR